MAVFCVWPKLLAFPEEDKGTHDEAHYTPVALSVMWENGSKAVGTFAISSSIFTYPLWPLLYAGHQICFLTGRGCRLG